MAEPDREPLVTQEYLDELMQDWNTFQAPAPHQEATPPSHLKQELEDFRTKWQAEIREGHGGGSYRLHTAREKEKIRGTLFTGRSERRVPANHIRSPETSGDFKPPFSEAKGRHGSRQHKMVLAVVESPYLLRDIPKLSPFHQTYSLEVFHSVVNHFAPKSTHFFYSSMQARLYVAALHYNENGKKERAVTKEGKEKWQISYPKAKKGLEAVVKPCKIDPTYGYVSLLVQATVARRKELPNYRVATEDSKLIMGSTPPSLTDSYEDFNKDDLIQRHRSRFT